MFFYEYPTLSYHLKAVFYFIWYFLLCFSEIPFTIDCRVADRSYAVADCYARKSAATIERRVADRSDAVGNGNGCKTAAAESVRAYCRDATVARYNAVITADD